MVRSQNQNEVADIESRILALSQGIDALKDDALSLFVAHRNQEHLRIGLARLIQDLDSAWQGCNLDAVVAEPSPLGGGEEQRPG